MTRLAGIGLVRPERPAESTGRRTRQQHVSPAWAPRRPLGDGPNPPDRGPSHPQAPVSSTEKPAMPDEAITPADGDAQSGWGTERSRSGPDSGFLCPRVGAGCPRSLAGPARPSCTWTTWSQRPPGPAASPCRPAERQPRSLNVKRRASRHDATKRSLRRRRVPLLRQPYRIPTSRLASRRSAAYWPTSRALSSS